MKAILYEVFVADSAIDSAHGLIYTIKEIHIPEYKISINSKFIFTSNKGRYKHVKKIGEINITKQTADIFKIYLKSQKVAMNMAKDLLNLHIKNKGEKKIGN